MHGRHTNRPGLKLSGEHRPSEDVLGDWPPACRRPQYHLRWQPCHDHNRRQRCPREISTVDMAFVNPSACLTQAYKGTGLFTPPFTLTRCGQLPFLGQICRSGPPQNWHHAPCGNQETTYPGANARPGGPYPLHLGAAQPNPRRTRIYPGGH